MKPQHTPDGVIYDFTLRKEVTMMNEDQFYPSTNEKPGNNLPKPIYYIAVAAFALLVLAVFALGITIVLGLTVEAWRWLV